MFPLALAIGLLLAVCGNLWCVQAATSRSNVCYFGQEPDPSQAGRLRWAMPGTHTDHCGCTSVRLGGLNILPVHRLQQPSYTDAPIVTRNKEEIHGYFDCHVCSSYFCTDRGDCYVSADGQKKCWCYPGFYGEKCELERGNCDNYICKYSQSCIPHNGYIQCDCGPYYRGTHCEIHVEKDCQALLDAGYTMSDVYSIMFYYNSIEVYCRMGEGEKQDEGWIVIQRRQDGSEDFARTWEDYMHGFGNKAGEYWLGNENLKQLTSDSIWELLIDLKDVGNNRALFWARPFRVQDLEYEVIGVDGTRIKFSTFDRLNDRNECAFIQKGGWWFGPDCSAPGPLTNGLISSNLNGQYHPEQSQGTTNSIKWADWQDHRILWSEMKIRRYDPKEHTFEDCQGLLEAGHNMSGVYTIYPPQAPFGFQVFCQMDVAAHSGWIVFQKRYDGSVNFTRNWIEYRDGFGDLAGEFWLGNKAVQRLTQADATNTRMCRLKIHIVHEVNGRREDNSYSYNYFKLETAEYKLLVTSAEVNQESQLDLYMFSTYDRDHDEAPLVHCAAELGSGWWFQSCLAPSSTIRSNLNGEYGSDAGYRGMRWADLTNIVESSMSIHCETYPLA